MHLRGKAMMVEAILPTGQKQVISERRATATPTTLQQVLVVP